MVEVLARSPVDVATLLFGEAAPYSVEFPIFSAYVRHSSTTSQRAHMDFARCWRLFLTRRCFAFWGVEQRGILLAASRSELPVP